MLDDIQAYNEQPDAGMGIANSSNSDFPNFQFESITPQPNFAFSSAAAYADPPTADGAGQMIVGDPSNAAGPSQPYIAASIEDFPLPDHAVVDNATGPPPARPQGCTEAARAGWDLDGWWYRGEHDTCPIPTAHRHDHRGHVTFAGFNDVMRLVTEIIERVRSVGLAA